VTARHIYVDETKERGYVMVASAHLGSEAAVLRSTLRQLVLPGQHRLHMAKENSAPRRAVVEVICAAGVTATIYDTGRRAIRLCTPNPERSSQFSDRFAYGGNHSDINERAAQLRARKDSDDVVDRSECIGGKYYEPGYRRRNARNLQRGLIPTELVDDLDLPSSVAVAQSHRDDDDEDFFISVNPFS
jgi:hypothetical protein